MGCGATMAANQQAARSALGPAWEPVDLPPQWIIPSSRERVAVVAIQMFFFLDCFALSGLAMTVHQQAAPTGSDIVSSADRRPLGHALTSASFAPVEGTVLARGRVLLKA